MTDHTPTPHPPLPPERAGGGDEKDGTLLEIAGSQDSSDVPTGNAVERRRGWKVGDPRNKGNTTNLGRPPVHVRLRCLHSFEERVHYLEEIADGVARGWVMSKEGPIRMGPSLKDRRDALELLGRYAGVERIVVEMNERRSETGDAILARALGMMARAVMAAPASQRVGVLRDLEAIEAQLVEGPDGVVEAVPGEGVSDG